MMPTLATLPAEPSAALRTLPRQIGRFAVRSEIGRGSNGVVYAAVDPMLGREIAIKAIPLSNDDFFRRQIEANFLQEAKSAAILNHHGIVTVFDAGKTEDLAYIAMERLHGRDLHEFMAAGQTLSAQQAAQLMGRVADAVHYAHKQGLIHRDIKPSNIFLLRDLKPKVLDFGIALANRSEGAQQKRQLIGTPNYMSPEQALGRPLDARSDVFSIGAILYELLAGRRAFEGKTVEDTVGQVIANTPPPLEALRPDTPRPLVEIVARAMASDLEQRYATAGELRNALTAFLAVTAPGTTRRATVRVGAGPAPGGLLHDLVDSARRNPLLTGAVAVLALATLGLAGVSLTTHEAPPAAVQQPAAAIAAPPPTTIAAPEPEGPAAVIGVPSPAPSVGTGGSGLAGSGGTERVAPALAPREAARADARRTRAPETAVASNPVPPPADGAIALAITPWGEVFVDGVSRGVSPPLSRLNLAPGVHTIEIRNGDAPVFTARIDVRAGQTVAVQHRF